MFHFNKKPKHELAPSHLVLDRFKTEIQRAVSAALAAPTMPSAGGTYALQRDLSKALRDAAQLLDVSRAINQPL